MKRNLQKICVVLILFFLCTGCVKYQAVMTIHNTKSMDLQVIYAINQSIINQPVLSDEEKNILLKNGYKAKNYKSSDYEGVKVTYHIPNIDKVSDTKKVSYSLNDMKRKKPEKLFTIKKHFFYNEYLANFTFESTDISNLTASLEGDSSIQEYLCDDGSVISIDSNNSEVPAECHSAFPFEIENAKKKQPLSSEELSKEVSKDNELTFTLKVGKETIQSNADEFSKNKRELVWKLKDNGITNIQFQFQLYNYFSIIGFVLVIVLSLFFCLFFIKKFFFKCVKNS